MHPPPRERLTDTFRNLTPSIEAWFLAATSDRRRRRNLTATPVSKHPASQPFLG